MGLAKEVFLVYTTTSYTPWEIGLTHLTTLATHVYTNISRDQFNTPHKLILAIHVYTNT